MTVSELLNVAWTRKHDDPGTPRFASVPRIVFPTSLEEVIEVCSTRGPGERFHAAGSHWALSDAAFADHTFVETHDPNNLFPAMGRTLYDVVPGCLNDELIAALASQTVPAYDATHSRMNAGAYLVHFETGKRVFQAYAEMDQGDTNRRSLAELLARRGNTSYRGPWAFQTLGGAGGQTVFGALTTGTHGGDFVLPPIADCVQAMHLVVDGGSHYWIERETTREFGVRITDDDKLRQLYDDDRYRGNRSTGKDNFEIIRDDDVFNAVLVGAGRFGIVYSVVVKAVRQYTLHEQRRLHTWQDVKTLIAAPASPLFSRRFLQIAVSITPFANNSLNLAGVTKRFNTPMALDPATGIPSGRAERVGAVVQPFNAGIGGPLFEFAGASHSYSPDPAHPGSAADPSFLEKACMNADFLQGVIQEVIDEVNDFVNSNGAEIGVGIAAVAVVGGAAALLALLAALAILVVVLALILASLPNEPHLGNALNDLQNGLLNRSDPAEQRAGVLIWQMIAFKIFSGQQGNLDYDAISYAVMDRHDYFDASCNVNVDSIEVFFDANDPMLIAFVDALLAFEAAQETMGRAFVGYASLRFTSRTSALLGEERSARTCVVEVAGLKDVAGVTPLIDFAVSLALDPNFHAVLHWGQRNDADRADIQRSFGDTFTNRTGPLHRWRNALSRLTDNGRLDGFSSQFTRTTGLEVVTPRVGTFTAPATVTAGQPMDFSWDCTANPPGTTVTLFISAPWGNIPFAGLPHAGHRSVPASAQGTVVAVLVVSFALGGENRDDVRTEIVTVTP
jgi:hypothetical protein